MTHIYLFSPILTLLAPFRPMAPPVPIPPKSNGTHPSDPLSCPFYWAYHAVKPLFIGPHRADQNTNDCCGHRLMTTGCKEAEQSLRVEQV